MFWEPFLFHHLQMKQNKNNNNKIWFCPKYQIKHFMFCTLRDRHTCAFQRNMFLCFGTFLFSEIFCAKAWNMCLCMGTKPCKQISEARGQSQIRKNLVHPDPRGWTRSRAFLWTLLAFIFFESWSDLRPGSAIFLNLKVAIWLGSDV